MKQFLLFFICLLIAQLAFSQNNRIKKMLETKELISELMQKELQLTQNKKNNKFIQEEIQHLKEILQVENKQYNSNLLNNSKGYFTNSQDYYEWDESMNDWKHKERMITPIYDENGLAEEIAFEIYDETAEDWVNDNQYLYTYDELDRVIERIHQLWDGTEWINDEKDVYRYEGNSNQLVMHEEWSRWEWDVTWGKSYCWEKVFDSEGRCIEELRKWGSFSNEWEYLRKFTTVYHDNGAKEVKYYDWNPIAEEWVFTRHYCYNENGNFTEGWSKEYDDETYELIRGSKSIWEYSNNKLANSIVYTLDISSDSWTEVSKGEYFYNEQGNRYESLYYEWISGSWNLTGKSSSIFNDENLETYYYYYSYNESSFEIVSRYAYTYENTDTTNTSEQIYQQADGDGWINIEKDLWVKSTNQNTLSYHYGYNWDDDNDQWDLYFGSKRYVLYNEQGQKIKDVRMSSTFTGWMGHTNYYKYNNEGMLCLDIYKKCDGTEFGFENDHKYEYGYIFIDTETQLLNPERENNLIFQNPYVTNQPIQYINNSKENVLYLKVYSITGKNVYGTKFNNNENVYITKELNEGLYFFVISTENKVLTKQKVYIK